MKDVTLYLLQGQIIHCSIIIIKFCQNFEDAVIGRLIENTNTKATVYYNLGSLN